MKEEKRLENADGWSVTTKRFVGFLDIMGFKDLVMRESNEKVKEILQSVTDYVKQFIDLKSEFNSLDSVVMSQSRRDSIRNSIKKTIKIEIFSDSIIVFSRDDSSESFINFLIVLSEIMVGRLNSKRPIPLKGACAHGIMTVDTTNRIFFGQPLIDAYLLQEKEVYYYGVVCHHTIDCYVRDKSDDSVKQISDLLLFESDTILKSGRISHNNLNYFLYFSDSDSTNDLWNDVVKNLKCLVSGAPKRYVDNTQCLFSSVSEKKFILKEKFSKELFFSLINQKCYSAIQNYFEAINLIEYYSNYAQFVDWDTCKMLYKFYREHMNDTYTISLLDAIIKYNTKMDGARYLRGKFLYSIQKFDAAVADFDFFYNKYKKYLIKNPARNRIKNDIRNSYEKLLAQSVSQFKAIYEANLREIQDDIENS